jgi:hypothetical protein
MATIRIERTLAAPIDGVFAVISDHAGYSRFPGVKSSELVREGELERDGVGAQRRIRFPPLTFVEDITHFERPVRMDYLITGINAPMTHHGGSMLLAESGAGTHVTWTSSFDFDVPVIGGLLGAIARAIFSRGFQRVLDETERLATAPEPAAAATAQP